MVSTRTTHHKCDFQRTWEIIRANVPENWSGQQTRNRPRSIKDGTNQVFHEPTRSFLEGLCQMLAGTIASMMSDAAENGDACYKPQTTMHPF